MIDGGLLTVDEALARILAAVSPLPPVVVSLDAALGLALASPITAPLDLPSHSNSAMDGYAIRAIETAAASPAHPATFRLVATIAAGEAPATTVGRGETVRIMTGAMIPDGADAVVRFEDTDESSWPNRGEPSSHVAVMGPVKAADNIRRTGEDVRVGDEVVPAGAVLDPAAIGLLAALGVDRVEARPRPRVGILSTGDELIPPGQVLRPGQRYDANGALLSAMVRDAGATDVPLGIAADRASEVIERLTRSTALDLIITSGGISAGDYDVVKDILRTHGNVAHWQVRMKPGRPLGFGMVEGIPLLGLPGNPVAAAVSFTVFARPLLARLAGEQVPDTPPMVARLATSIPNPGGRRQFVRATINQDAAGTLIALPVRDQGTGRLAMLNAASALVVIPETVAMANAGELFPVIVLNRGRERLPEMALPPG